MSFIRQDSGITDNKRAGATIAQIRCDVRFRHCGGADDRNGFSPLAKQTGISSHSLKGNDNTGFIAALAGAAVAAFFKSHRALRDYQPE
jgi:hypothetical protein